MSTTSAWACGTSELTPCTCLRMLSTDRFCESRMREILTSGSTRGEDVVPSHRLLSYSTGAGCTFEQPDLVSELLTHNTSLAQHKDDRVSGGVKKSAFTGLAHTFRCAVSTAFPDFADLKVCAGPIFHTFSGGGERCRAHLLLWRGSGFRAGGGSRAAEWGFGSSPGTEARSAPQGVTSFLGNAPTLLAGGLSRCAP